MAEKPKNMESTVLRMAGNIAAGMVSNHLYRDQYGPHIASKSVGLARLIVAEAERTAPPRPDPSQET